jgi:hypothetical protein
MIIATVAWAVVIVVRTAEREWLVVALAVVAGIFCALAARRARRESRG